MAQHYTYILECADSTLYVGSTNDLTRRVEEHNTSKRGAKYTKVRRPVVLRYSEEFETLSEARKRECEIKSWRREQKLALIDTPYIKDRREARERVMYEHDGIPGAAFL